MTALELRGVTVSLGRGRHRRVVADGIDLSVAEGTVLGLVGESGSGKSTVGRAAVGLLAPDRGEVLVDGRPVPAPGRGPSPAQLVFQDPGSSLDPRMSVGESIAEGLPDRRSLDRRTRVREVGRLLELVHLDPDTQAVLPRQLSGGQLQRVALARVLAARPRVVVADEITSALDVSVQAAVLNVVVELTDRLGISMLFISHNLAVVRHVSDRIAVMASGRIVECGPTEDVVARPSHPYTRSLLASVPTLDRHVPLEPAFEVQGRDRV